MKLINSAFAFCSLLVIGLTIALPTCTQADEPATSNPNKFSDSLRDANPLLITAANLKVSVENALPYIEKRGKWWMDKKECMSCHRTSFMAWSHIEASDAGVDIDQSNVNAWIDWSMNNLFEPFPEKDQKFDGELTIERNLSGAAQMIALARNWQSTESQVANQKLILEKLIEGQKEDGSWHAHGQLPSQKRELTETTHVFTIWNALAVHDFGKTGSEEQRHKIEPMVDAAFKFASDYEGGESAEWFALRSLFAFEQNDLATSKKFQKRLMKSQNEDGGWGWKLGESSDVLATAQVVYAMLETDIEPTSLTIQRSLKFIVESQTKKGSWLVNGTKKKAADEPQETSNYWGTTWAVIAMSKSLASMQ